MKTREEMLERAEQWILRAEGERLQELEIRLVALADAWLRLAAEVRKGSVPASPDVN